MIVEGVGLNMRSAGVTTPSVKQTAAQASALETSADLSPKNAHAAKHSVVVRKIGTQNNVSDMLMRASDSTTISKHMVQMGLESYVPDNSLQKTV